MISSKMSSDENRFDTLSQQIEKTTNFDKDITKEFAINRFKEDYYIKQQSSDTSLILTVFGVTVVIFGIFSYTLFESRINEHKNYFTDKIREQDNKYYSLQIHLNDLLKNTASDKGYENMIKAKENYEKQNYDWYVYFSLEAVSNFSEYFLLSDSQEIKNFTTDTQITTLKEVVKNIEKLSISINNLEPTVTQKYITNILRFQNIEITDLVCRIKGAIID